MSSRRVLKAAQAIREVVSMAIIADLKDPRIENVTVTLVEVAGDMRNAKVNVSVMGDEAKQKLCLRGLQSSAGYLQQKVGKRIDTRYTPRLQFVLDKGLQNSMVVARILDEVLPQKKDEQSDSSPGEDLTAGDEAPAAAVNSGTENSPDTLKPDQSATDPMPPDPSAPDPMAPDPMAPDPMAPDPRDS